MATLNSAEMEQAQAIINKTSAGIYELSEIYGSVWPTINKPTDFGANFKETVESSVHLKNIKHHSRKGNNHQTYEIFCT